MEAKLDFIGLDGQISEISAENAGYVQIQNISHKTIRVTDDAYLMGRAFALVREDNNKVSALIDKGIVRLIDTPRAKVVKQAEKPKSRKKIKREEADQQKQVLENLGQLFQTHSENVRQTP